MFFVASGHYTNRNDPNLMGHLDHAYIVSETLPIYPDVASLVKIISYLYSVVWGKLYMIGLSTILMQFLEHDEVEYSHAEVHEGISKQHFRGRALVMKVIIVGYYSPSMV